MAYCNYCGDYENSCWYDCGKCGKSYCEHCENEHEEDCAKENNSE